MAGKISLFFLCAIFVFGFVTASAAQTTFLFHQETGWLNYVYHQKEYKDNNASTFPALMNNFGFEFSHKNSEGIIQGGGLAVINVGSARQFNYDYYETRDGFSVMCPYMFVGNGTKYFGFETGVSWYLTIDNMAQSEYLQADGTAVPKRNSGMGLSNTKSYAFINFLVRILPEDSFHFVLSMGRGRFNIIDSLFSLRVILPFDKHTGEIYYSLPTDLNSYFPLSNQRFGLAYSYNFSSFTIGATLGYLASNRRAGGGGNMSVTDLHKFSAGLNAMISL
jgi:hypothetical protein